MKNTIFQIIFILFLSFQLFSQTPNGFNYQAVAREANGSPISKKQISVRFTILQDDENGDNKYIEYHKVKTSDLGTFSAVIGGGTVKDVKVNSTISSSGTISSDSNIKTKKDYKYHTPKTYYYQIPPASFNQVEFDDDSQLKITINNIYIQHSNAITTGHYSGRILSSINLPDGAIIKKVKLYYRIFNEGQGDATINCHLFRR